LNPNQPKLRWAENNPTETSPPCGPGPLLRDARLARRLDIGLAADQLKLRRDVLEAMERDDYSSLPEPIYLRGYLASYARLLGLAEKEVLQQFAVFKGEPEAPVLTTQRPVHRQARSSDARVRWFSYLVIILMAGGIGWWSYERSRQAEPRSVFADSEQSAAGSLPSLAGTPEALDPPGTGEPRTSPGDLGEADVQPPPEDLVTEELAATMAPESPVPASPEPATSASDAKPAVRARESPALGSEETGQNAANQTTAMASQDADVAARSALPAAAERPLASQPATAAAPVVDGDGSGGAARAGAPTLSSSGGDRLELAFRRDCWLEVRDASGERLAFGLAKAGSTRQLAGASPFRILLGDSGGVAIRLNGAQVAPRVYDARDGRPARFSLGGEEATATQG
jgi:cytoskeleton protein RodZ